MGLIKAMTGAAKSNLADQWKEFISAPSMDGDILVQKGSKRDKGSLNSGKSSNTKGSDNVISEGSVIVVSPGQAAIVVSNGGIVDFSAEPGEYIMGADGEPSMFTGSLSENVKETFNNMADRFKMGGDTTKEQVIYYVNTKEIVGNKFGSSSPVAYDDQYYGTVLYMRYFGMFSFNVVDPLKLFSSIAGNVDNEFRTSDLMEQCRSEFYTALDVALGTLGGQGVKFSLLATRQQELADIMNDVLDSKWRENRGLEIVSVGIDKITPDDKSRERIEQFDQASMYGRNSNAAQGRMLDAQAQMFENMGTREGGASTGDMMGGVVGLMGMGMFNGQNNQGQPTQQPTQEPVQVEPEQAKNTWKCSCGTESTGNFCNNCGAKRVDTGQWTCKCGAINKGKFCSNCGEAVQMGKNSLTCKECGKAIEEGARFCGNCGAGQ